MNIIKFGGKSLANGNGLQRVIQIIKEKKQVKERIVVVVSARGNTTNKLEDFLEKARTGNSYKQEFENFKAYQLEPLSDVNFQEEFTELSKIFEGVTLLGDYSQKVKDKVLSYGEVLSAKTIVALLAKEGLQAQFTDARKLLLTDNVFGAAQPLHTISEKKVQTYFSKIAPNVVSVVTGFIASNLEGETTTLGRNGSNYTASLLANYLNANEFQNYTHVDGIYTANPEWVSNAKKIEHLTFQEANELANFGASILHAKTIIPLLEKNIPLRILNTFNAENTGTLISANNGGSGIKSVNVISNVALVNFEGRGLLGKVGIDARIFSALSKENISVSIISQGSSERGIGFVVAASEAENAKKALEREFEGEFLTNDVSAITINKEIGIISAVGQELQTFHNPFSTLVKNHIQPLLINNTLSGKNVCLVVKKEELKKAVNVIHGEIFGISTRINIAIFGKGLVGGTLIDQILKSKESVLQRKNIALNIFAVGGTKHLLLDKEGIKENWKEVIHHHEKNYTVANVIAYAEEHHLENLIAVDNTADTAFVENYISLVEHGFDLVSSNKIANTVSFDFYKKLREKLNKHQKQYLYETNVGAGLPLIDTIRLLHHSGENITRIKGVFSGSLSYLFNTFSLNGTPFSKVLKKAIDAGYTEPDPREDLCGNDVGRKLLILARELDLKNEFSDINIQNLIPENLRDGNVTSFLNRLEELDVTYAQVKENQAADHVLRYIGDLHGDLSGEKGKLDVQLVSVPKNSALGQVQGSDSIFEIYTESYGERPLVIQGAGAGAQVTARGVFGDILRLAEKNN
jgi:aspartokinase/homoserine dehydrogenase 1